MRALDYLLKYFCYQPLPWSFLKFSCFLPILSKDTCICFLPILSKEICFHQVGVTCTCINFYHNDRIFMFDVCFIFQALCWEDFNRMLGTSQFRSWPEDEKIVAHLLQTWWCSSKVKWWKKHPSPIWLSFPCLSSSYSLTSLPWSLLPSSLFLVFLSSLALF